MLYHTYDGENWNSYETLTEAMESATVCIGYAREACDPEWPEYVENIEVVFSDINPTDDIEIFEDTAIVIATAVQTNVSEDESGQCDYFCDYEMRLFE